MKAFYGCKELESITLPASVTSIGEGAFEESGLISISLQADSSLSEIWRRALSGLQITTMPPTMPPSV